MKTIEARKKEAEQLLATANLLDDEGQHQEADKLTALASKMIEAMEDDQDAEDAASPVDGGDPFAKGFGKSIATLCKKLNSVCGANNLKKKLRDLCEAADCDVSTAREIERTLEDACDSLNKLCK